MSLSLPRALALLAGVAAAGCADKAIQAPQGPALGLNIGALDLAGAADACYSIAVRNAAQQPVWEEPWICGSRYGFETSVTYIGPCDADDGDGNGEATNTVSLVMRAVCGDDCVDGNTDLVADNDLGQWQNPCPADRPCERPALCRQNADTQVEFNLTVMRAANQGFFDIAVNFEDIFCSAKLDCEYGPNRPIELLHHPVTQTRIPTAVLATACTGGAGEAPTHLYFDAVQITCDGVTTTLPLDRATAGNLYSAESPAPARLLQAATWRGLEALTDTSGKPLGKVYFNIGVAPDLAAIDQGCSIAFTATASSGPFVEPFTTPANTSYPVIRVAHDDLVVVEQGTARLGCGINPLNDPNAPAGQGVFTEYTTSGQQLTFAYLARASAGALEVVKNTRQSSGNLLARGGAWGYDAEQNWVWIPDPSADAPLAGVLVEVYANGQVFATTTTDQAGNFAVEVPTGSYEIVVNSLSLAREGRSGGLVDWENPLAFDAPVADLVVYAHPPARLFGTLFGSAEYNGSYEGGASQTPLVGAELTFEDVDRGLAFTVVTDADGRYEILVPGESSINVTADFTAGAFTDFVRFHDDYNSAGSVFIGSSQHGEPNNWDFGLLPYKYAAIEVYVRYQYPGSFSWQEWWETTFIGAQVDLYDMTNPNTPVLLGTELVQARSGDFSYTIALFGTRPDYGPSPLIREGRSYRVVLRDDLSPFVAGMGELRVSSDSDSEGVAQNYFDVFFPISEDTWTRVEDIYFDIIPQPNATIEAYPVYYDINQNGTYDEAVDALLSGLEVKLYGNGPNGYIEDAGTSVDGRIVWTGLLPHPDNYDMWLQGDWWGDLSTRPIPNARKAIDGHNIFPVGPNETVRKAFSVEYDDATDVSLLASVVDATTGTGIAGVTLQLTPKSEVPDGVTGWEFWPKMAAYNAAGDSGSTGADGGFLFDFQGMFAGFYTLGVDPATIPAGYTLVGTNSCDVFVSTESPVANCNFQLQATAPSNPEPEPFVGNSIDGLSSVQMASPTYVAGSLSLDSVVLAEPGRVRVYDATNGAFIGESGVIAAGTHSDLDVGALAIPWDDDGTAHLEVVLVAEDDGAALADATFSAWGALIDFAVDSWGFATDQVLHTDPHRLTFERLRGAAPGTNYVVAFSGNTGVLVAYAPFQEPMQWPVTLDFLDQPEWDHDAPAQMFCGGFAPPDLCPIDGGSYDFVIMSADAWAQYGVGEGQVNDLQSLATHLLTPSVGGSDAFYIYNALGD